MKKLVFKKEGFLIVLVLLMLIVLSLSVYALETCCLNPLGGGGTTCNSELDGDIDPEVCCTPLMGYDTEGVYGGIWPTSEENCLANFYDDSNDCSTTPLSDACRVEICCCDPDLKTGSLSYEALCNIDPDKDVITYSGTGDCTTECGAPAPTAPDVSDIPYQMINEGETFSTINLDDYVTDNDADDLITWTYSGNTVLTVNIDANRVATITYTTGWTGSETITFTATDTDDLAASDSAMFIVNPITEAPVVLDIQDQTITSGQIFSTINLDYYVVDQDTADNLITWQATGGTNIIVSITNRIASITYTTGWTGSETITFTATDLDTLSDSNTATFTVNEPAPPPECISEPSAPIMTRVNIRPGNKGLELLWKKPTTGPEPTSYNIYRKCDSGCSDVVSWFILENIVCSVTNCIYVDSDAEWDKTYSYKVSSVYYGVESALGDALPSKGPGEKDCKGRIANVDFCLDNIAYTGCDQNNIKQINEDCESQGKTCIMDGPNAVCRDDAPCDSSGYPFALYYTDNTAKYNFYDVSKTVVDTCYSCSNIANCYDYKSSGACSDDDCGVGSCLWKDYGANSISDDLEEGVCVDISKDNCMFCSNENTDALNYEAYNPIFDACTPEKASLLSTANYDCNYFASTRTAKSCSEATCYDFDTQAMCDSGGVDLCGLGVCYWDTTTCVKDSDNDLNDDCGTYEDCRKDMSPPLTNIFIEKTVLDGTENLHVEANDAETSIRETYFCIDQANVCDPTVSGCAAGSTITLLGVGSSVMGTNVCTGNTLEEGTNYVRFYSIDMHSNVEPVKSIQFDVDTTPPELPGSFASISTPSAGTISGTTKLTVALNFNEQVKCGFVSTRLNINEPIESAPCYSSSYVEVFDNIAEGSGYTLTITCEDTTGNRISKNYDFDIDNDPSITIVEPEFGLYDIQSDIVVRTPGNVDCRYIQNSDIVAYDQMVDSLTREDDPNKPGQYLHTLLSTDYAAISGSNTFNIACKVLEEKRDSVSFVYDTIPPTIVLNDENDVQVDFSKTYTPQQFNLVCSDEPTDGFDCNTYVCIVTTGDTCDPPISTNNWLDRITLSETTKICYQAVENTINSMGTKHSQTHCGTVTVDAARPDFTFTITSGITDLTPIAGGFTLVTITSGDYGIQVTPSEALADYPEIDLESSGYKYKFTSTDCPDANTNGEKDDLCSAIFTISSDGTSVTLKDSQGTPTPLLQNLPVTDGGLSITLGAKDVAGNDGDQIYFNIDDSSVSELDLSIDVTPPQKPTIADDYVGTFYIASEDVVIEGTFDADDTKELLLYVSENSDSYTGPDTGALTITDDEFSFVVPNSNFPPDDISYIFIVAEDALGNIAQAEEVPVVVRDGTAPTITDDYTSGGIWINSDQTITLIPEDIGGSGIKEVKYCNGADCAPTNFLTSPYEFTYDSDQNTIVRYQAWDNADNPSAIGEFNVRIDKTPPTITNDYADDGVWVNTDQTITLDPQDTGGSEIKEAKYCEGTDCTPDTTLTTPYTLSYTTNQNTIVRYQAWDNAGNPSAIGEFNVKIDKTPPTFSGETPTGVIGPGDEVLVSVIIADADNNLDTDSIELKIEDKTNGGFLGDNDGDDYVDSITKNPCDASSCTIKYSFIFSGSEATDYEVTAEASDESGNKEETTWIFTVDPNVPEAPEWTSDDFGPGTDKYYVSVLQPTITIEFDVTDKLTELKLNDGVADIELLTPDVDGTYDYIPANNLVAGTEYTLTVTAKKKLNGDYGPEVSYSIDLVVDTTKPKLTDLSIIKLPNNKFKIKGYFTETNIYSIKINDVNAQTRNTDNFVSAELDSGVFDNGVEIKLQDKADNSETITIQKDNAAFTLDTIPAYVNTEITVSGKTTYLTSTVEIKQGDAKITSPLVDPIDGTFSAVLTLAEGDNEFIAYNFVDADSDNYIDTIYTRTIDVVLDTALPTASNWVPVSGETVSYNQQIISVVIDGTGSDVKCSTLDFKVNGVSGTPTGCSDAATVILTYDPLNSLIGTAEQGQVLVEVSIADIAGNPLSTQNTFYIDTRGPIVKLSNNIEDIILSEGSYVSMDDASEMIVEFSQPVTADQSDLTVMKDGMPIDMYLFEISLDEKTYVFAKTSGTFENGAYTISVHDVKDSQGYTLPAYTLNFYLDSTAPTNPSLIINNDEEYTSSTEVILTLSATDSDFNPDIMMISESQTFFDAGEEPYSTSKEFTLSSIEGEKTVYAKFKNPSGLWSGVVSDTIFLDTTEPEITDDYADDGSWVSSSQEITLLPEDNTGGSGIEEVKYCSGDGCDPSTGTSLDSPYGLPKYKTNQNTIVRYQTWDNAGNPSAIGEFNVKIDTTLPTVEGIYANNGVWVNSEQVIELDPDDEGGSELKEVKCCEGSSSCTPDTILNSPYRLSYTSDKNTMVRCQAWDNAGSPSAIRIFSVKIDKARPVVSKPTSPTHPDESKWYNSYIATLNWAGATDQAPSSGIAGYRYLFNEQIFLNYNLDGSITGGINLDAAATKLESQNLNVVDDYKIKYFHIQAYDNAGNYGAVETYKLKIDTKNPEVSFAPSEGEITNDVLQPITISVDGTGSDVDCNTLSLTVKGVDVTDKVSCTNAGTVALTYVPTQSYLTSGITTNVDIDFTISDTAGKTYSVRNLLLFVVDTSVSNNPIVTLDPALTASSGDKEKIGATYDNYYYLNNNLNTITFTFEDVINQIPVTRIKQVELKVGDEAATDITGEDTDTSDYIFRYDPTDSLTEGKYVITIIADKKVQLSPELYGGEKTWIYYFVVDTSDPSASNLQVERFDGTNYVPTKQANNNWLTNSINIKIKGDYSDSPDITGIETLRHVKFDNVNAILDTFNDKFEAEIVLAPTQGVKTIGMEIKDKAVNTITQDINVELDTSGPGLRITNIDLDGDGPRGWYYSSDNSNWAPKHYTNQDSIHIKGSVGKSQSLIDEIIVKEDDNILTDANDLSWLQGSDTEFAVIVPTDFAGDLKTYNLTVIAKDKAGTQQTSPTITVVKDNVFPTITLLQPVTLATTSQTPTIGLDTAEPTICSMSYYVSTSIKVEVSFGTTYSATPITDIPSTKILRNNFITPITFKCTDMAGNQATKIIDIHVDNKKPTITNVEVVDGEEISVNLPYDRNYRFYRDSLITALRVTADENVRCKYHTAQQSFANMPYKFINFDNSDLSVAFKRISETENIGLTDDSTVTYYIDCEDKAGNTANNQFVVNLAVDKDITIGITSLMGEYVNTKTPIIKVETDRNALCTIDTNYQGFFGFFRDMFTRPVEMITIDYLIHQFPQSVLEWEDELDESFYRFTVTCHDQTDSGIDDGIFTFGFIVDVTAPNKPIITTQSPIDVKEDFTITGTIETIDEEDRYVFLKGHEAVNALISDNEFTLEIPVSALSIGGNTIRVIAKDSAGNKGPESDPITVNYVITAPQFKQITPESGTTKKEVTEILVEFSLVNDVPIDFTTSEIEVLKESTTVTGTTSQVSNTAIKFTPTSLFTNGDYDVLISVYDQLGNSEYYLKGFTVDDRAPVPRINSSLIPSHTNSPQINIVGTVSDANHDIIAVTIIVYDENDNVAIPETPITISEARSVSINETITLVEDGTYRIVVRAMNAVLVESSSNAVYVTLDRVEPEADIIIG